MATDGSELEVSCRLRPRATAGPASNFVLVPSSGPPCISTDGDSAGAVREALVLQDGVNVVEMAERDAVGVGLENAEGGVYERQVLLKTVNSSTMVMLKAYCDLRVRGRQHSSASPSPRKPRASPAKKTARPLSPAGKGLRATSPTKMLRISPAKMLRASPGRAGRGMSGGAARIAAGAQQFLLVGDTLDLGISGGTKSASCRFSYTLQLASPATARGSGAGTPGKPAPGAVKSETATTPSTSSRAEPSDSSDRGRGTDTKRRLEDIFNDKNVVGEAGAAAGRPAFSSAVCAGEGDDGARVTPRPIEVVEVDDDDDDDDDGKGAAVPAPAPTTASKRRRRNDDARSKPVGVVDLCGSDDRPVDAGTSKDAPLDLCDSDDEGKADEPRTSGAQAAGAAEPSGSFGGSQSSFFSSSLGSHGGRAPSKNRPLKPARLVPASTKNHGPPDAPSTTGGSAALAVVKADVPWERATSSTAIRNFRPKVERPALLFSSSSSPSRSAAAPGEGTAARVSQKPPYIPRGTVSSSVGEEEGEEEEQRRRRQQQRERGENKKAFSIFTQPRKRDGKSPYLDVGADGAAAAPTVAAGTRRASTPMPMATRALTRMDDILRRTVRSAIKDCPESSVPVIKEVLGRGTAPVGGLCETIVSSLLESRCNVRTECLRRQLHAMLDVDPDSWTPPEDTAPIWLDDLHAVITGRRSARTETHEDRPPSDAVLTAHVAVLEVVVDYVVAGRTPIVSGGGGGGGDKKGALLTPPGDGLKTAGRVMQFFECPRKKGRWEREPTQSDRARHAVETCAAWAVGAFGRSEGAGEGAGSTRGGHRAQQRRRQRRPESPSLVRARVLTARLLAEVVETCGLTAEEACLTIAAQMNSFAGGASADGAGVQEEACRGLGSAARSGLVRALLGRPFCAQLARVLLADLKGAGDVVVEGDAGGVGRLEALLLRVGNREQGRASAGVVLI